METTEKSISCPIVNNIEANAIQTKEPGEPYRGVVRVWKYNCDEPLLKGDNILFGTLSFDDFSNSGFWKESGYQQIITEEGGSWLGPFDATYSSGGATTIKSTLKGDGKYKGMEMDFDYDDTRFEAATKLTIRQVKQP